jgi:integrase
MIHKRGKRWRVIVYAGRDPITGRKRQKSVTVDSRAEAKRAEARLITEVGAGQHQPDGGRAAGPLAGLAPERPAHLAYHRRHLPRLHRPLHPAHPRQAPARLAGRRDPGRLLRPPAQAGRQGRPADGGQQRPSGPCHSLGRAQPGGGVGLDRQQPGPARLAALDRTDGHAAPAVEDAARLLSVALAEDRELGLFLRLAVVLGARRGELCAVRWYDVDLDQGEVLIAGGIVRVPGESLVDKATKTHAKRRVAVGADTAELLRAHRLAQAKDALACGTTLAADTYVFSHAPI